MTISITVLSKHIHFSLSGTRSSTEVYQMLQKYLFHSIQTSKYMHIPADQLNCYNVILSHLLL